MQVTNQKMEENIIVLSDTREKVLENQVQIDRSTAQLKHFRAVNKANMEVVKKTKDLLLPYGTGTLLLIGLLLLLLVPCVILAILYFKLPNRRK